MKPMLPWWQCSATILERDPVYGEYVDNELDHETRAATAEEAEYDARETWIAHGYNPERVKVRRLAE
jgi:hypothetical protein